jgi:hypothetical protein
MVWGQAWERYIHPCPRPLLSGSARVVRLRPASSDQVVERTLGAHVDVTGEDADEQRCDQQEGHHNQHPREQVSAFALERGAPAIGADVGPGIHGLKAVRAGSGLPQGAHRRYCGSANHRAPHAISGRAPPLEGGSA